MFRARQKQQWQVWQQASLGQQDRPTPMTIDSAATGPRDSKRHHGCQHEQAPASTRFPVESEINNRNKRLHPGGNNDSVSEKNKGSQLAQSICGYC